MIISKNRNKSEKVSPIEHLGKNQTLKNPTIKLIKLLKLTKNCNPCDAMLTNS